LPYYAWHYHFSDVLSLFEEDDNRRRELSQQKAFLHPVALVKHNVADIHKGRFYSGKTVNPFDLDALAERSGLKIPPVGSPKRLLPSMEIVALCGAFLIMVSLLAYWLCNFYSHQESAGRTRTAVSAPSAKDSADARLCAQRWAKSTVLFVQKGIFSAMIACGDPKSRVVNGDVEVAYPTDTVPENEYTP